MHKHLPPVPAAGELPLNAVCRASTVPDDWPHANEKKVDSAPRLSDRAYEKHDGAAEELPKASDSL